MHESTSVVTMEVPFFGKWSLLMKYDEDDGGLSCVLGHFRLILSYEVRSGGKLDVIIRFVT
jgi:hypothetical protein